MRRSHVNIICTLVLLLSGIGTRAKTTSLRIPDVNGVKVAPLESRNKKATVLLFITNDCPICNSYAPEIERIYKTYSAKGFGFYLVYVDPALTAGKVKQHLHDYSYTCPALLDHGHLLVKKLGATITPEAVVAAPDGKTLYRGRIDDLYVDFGKARIKASTRDLRAALDAIAQGKPVASAKTRAVGCYIANTGG